jgi:hypothetical protein
MEPRREDQKPREARGEPKPKRFRLIRLEERIAPGQGGNSRGVGCNHGYGNGTGTYTTSGTFCTLSME